MPNYKSRQYANSPNSGVGPHPGNAIVLWFEVPVTAALTTADTFEFGKVPKGFVLISSVLRSTDLDGATTLTYNVGDAGDADRLFAAATVGQTGTAAFSSAVTGAGYVYTAETVITGAVAANPGGTVPTSGTISLGMIGTILPLA